MRDLLLMVNSVRGQ